MQGLSFRFAVRCTDQRLGLHLESLLAPLRVTGPAAHWYSLVTRSAGRVDVRLDDTTVASLPDAQSAAAWLLWDLNRAVVDASSEHLLFHAGGVQAGDSGVLLPAPSGSGKTTLVAALVQAGLGYLSDEVIALTGSGAQLLPYSKPLTLKAGTFELLRGLQPAFEPAPTGLVGDEWHLRPTDIRADAGGGPCRPKVIVCPRYVPGAVTTLRRLEPTEAFLAIMVNTVNLKSHGARGVQLLADLVEQCDTYQLEMSDLREARRIVLGLLPRQGE